MKSSWLSFGNRIDMTHLCSLWNAAYSNSRFHLRNRFIAGDSWGLVFKITHIKSEIRKIVNEDLHEI